MKPENKAKLTAILTYHVVPGQVMAADVVKLKKAKTVQGAEVGIKVSEGKVMVDTADGDCHRYYVQQWRDSRHRLSHSA